MATKVESGLQRIMVFLYVLVFVTLRTANKVFKWLGFVRSLYPSYFLWSSICSSTGMWLFGTYCRETSQQTEREPQMQEQTKNREKNVWRFVEPVVKVHNIVAQVPLFDQVRIPIKKLSFLFNNSSVVLPSIVALTFLLVPFFCTLLFCCCHFATLAGLLLGCFVVASPGSTSLLLLSYFYNGEKWVRTTRELLLNYLCRYAGEIHVIGLERPNNSTGPFMQNIPSYRRDCFFGVPIGLPHQIRLK
jgi:hypothetical protein